MARHHDRLISRSRDAVAAAGQSPARTARRTPAEVESFVKGFGLSAAAVRQLVDEWRADADRAYSAGVDDGVDSCNDGY